MRIESELKKSPSGIKITNQAFTYMALAYIVLPILIFMAGYLKPVIAILFIACFIVGSISYIKNNQDKSLNDDGITISYGKATIITILITVLMFLAGIGEFCSCTRDHDVRFAILNDLVNYKWPIVYDFSTQMNESVKASLGDGQVAFAYYFTFWMIPAVVGKAFGLFAARITLLIWSVIGIWLMTIGVFLLRKRASIFTFLAIMMFAGIDVIPYTINVLTNTTTTFEGWNLHLFIHGNYYQLVNVYNQSIPGWLITILLMNSKSNKSIGFLGGLMFCYSPWATIGIAPLCVCELISKSKNKIKSKAFIKEVFTLGNLLTPIASFICFASLYTANKAATGDDGFIWLFYDNIGLLILDYVKYIVFEFGIWVLLIYKVNKKNPLFWTSIATLLVLPIYKISIANDFIMRGSMSPMFVISILAVLYVSEQFDVLKKSKEFVLKPRIAVLLLVLSAFVMANQLLVTTAATIEDKNNGGVEYGRDITSFGNIKEADQLKMVRTQFYVYDYEDAFFFKYLAK